MTMLLYHSLAGHMILLVILDFYRLRIFQLILQGFLPGGTPHCRIRNIFLLLCQIGNTTDLFDHLCAMLAGFEVRRQLQYGFFTHTKHQAIRTGVL